MAFYHGVKTSEQATSVIAPVQTTAGLPIVFGTAPVHLTEDPSAVINKPIICYSWEEAVQQLGYSEDWTHFTLCEAMYAQFKLYGVAPIVFVNVLDPAKHKKSTTTTATLTEKKCIVKAAVLLNTLQVSSGGQTGVVNTDYTAAFDDKNQLIISVIKGGKFDSASTLDLTYDELDVENFDYKNVIGGVDSNEKATGFELIDTIYHHFGIVPGLIAAPGFSQQPTVASVMKAKSRVINNLFGATTLVDIDTTQVVKYTDAYEWKKGNSYTGESEVVCWPMVRNGDYMFHMSTHIMGIIGKCDASNSDIPTLSPSNKSMNITGLCLANGKEVMLTHSQANLLNSQGIMTAPLLLFQLIFPSCIIHKYPKLFHRYRTKPPINSFVFLVFVSVIVFVLLDLFLSFGIPVFSPLSCCSTPLQPITRLQVSYYFLRSAAMVNLYCF